MTRYIHLVSLLEMDDGRMIKVRVKHDISCLVLAEQLQEVGSEELLIMPGLRHLITDDYDAIIHLWKEAGLRSVRIHGRDSRDAFAAQLAAGQTVIGLEEAGQLIGAIVVTNDRRKGWINRLAVHPDHRRKGHAAKLIATAEQELRARGIRIYAVLIESDNKASREPFFSGRIQCERCIIYEQAREQ